MVLNRTDFTVFNRKRFSEVILGSFLRYDTPRFPCFTNIRELSVCLPLEETDHQVLQESLRKTLEKDFSRVRYGIALLFLLFESTFSFLLYVRSFQLLTVK